MSYPRLTRNASNEIANMTAIQRFIESLQSTAKYNPESQVAPACILWTDPWSEFIGILPRLKEALAEIAVEKGATALLMPVTARKQLLELSDDMATKIDVHFYSDARDALMKALVE